MSERNVGDSSKDARPEVVEKTGDGSESAGLRERTIAESVENLVSGTPSKHDCAMAIARTRLDEAKWWDKTWGARLRAKTRANRIIELERVVAENEMGLTGCIACQGKVKDWCPTHGRPALTPAISRPPTQGSAEAHPSGAGTVSSSQLFYRDHVPTQELVSVSYPCGATASEGSPPNDCPIHGSDCIGGVRKLLKRMTEAATAQPPSLPPSRAESGGDRTDESKGGQR